jgi:hypothetical protein
LYACNLCGDRDLSGGDLYRRADLFWFRADLFGKDNMPGLSIMSGNFDMWLGQSDLYRFGDL